MAKILSKYRTTPGASQQTNPGQGTSVSNSAQGQPTQNQPQNVSGNFTNVSNYLKANQQAGERVGTRLGQGINQSLSAGQADVKSQVGKLSSDLSQAGSALERGESYQQELSKEGFDAQKFLQGTVPGTAGLTPGQQPTTKLEDFSKFRTGTAVDQSALEKQRGQALGSAITAQQDVGQKQKAIGSEAGRFGLLKQYLGGKDYKQGLQSLDQTFLQQQGQKSLARTQSDLREKNKNLASTQANLDTEQIKNIKDTVNRQKTLSEGLTKRTGELESGYISDLDKKVADVNAKRAADAERYQQFANQLTKGPTSEFQFNKRSKEDIASDLVKENLAGGMSDWGQPINPVWSGEAYNAELNRRLQEQDAAESAARSAFETGRQNAQRIDADLLKESGLQFGQQTFNVLNPNLQASDFIDFDKRQATRAQDIATQKNVDYYKALSDLAGISNAKLDRRGFLVGDNDQIAAGAKMASGDRYLGGRVNAAADQFLKDAMGANFVGSATETYGKRGLSSGSSTTQNAQINAASALTGLPPEYIGKLFDEMSTSAVQQSMLQDTAGDVITGGVYGMAKGLGDSLTGGALSNLQNTYNNAVQNAITDVGSSVGLWGDDGPQEAVRAARMHAQSQAQAQLQDWLKSKGYGNYLSDTGVMSRVGGLTGDQFGYTADKFAGTTATGGAGKESVSKPKQRVGINKDYIPQQLLNLPKLTSEDV